MDTFFSMDYNGVLPLLLRCVLFMGAGMLLWWLVFLLLCKTLYRKKKHHRDNLLRLVRLWSLVLVMLCVVVYFVVLIKRTGFTSVNWTSKQTLLGLTPLLLVYLLLMGLFIFFYLGYQKKIASTKII